MHVHLLSFQVNMVINENRAIVGSAVYVNDIRRCSWVGGTSNFNISRAYQWRFMRIGYALIYY